MRLASSLDASSGSREDAECFMYRNTLILRQFKFALGSRIGKKCNVTAGQIALAWLPSQGRNFTSIPGTIGLPVCPVSKSDWPIIFAEPAKENAEPQGDYGCWDKTLLGGFLSR